MNRTQEKDRSLCTPRVLIYLINFLLFNSILTSIFAYRNQGDSKSMNDYDENTQFDFNMEVSRAYRNLANNNFPSVELLKQ